MKSFLDKLDINYPVLLDPAGDVRSAYEIEALPTSYLIGRDGKISRKNPRLAGMGRRGSQRKPSIISCGRLSALKIRCVVWRSPGPLTGLYKQGGLKSTR